MREVEKLAKEKFNGDIYSAIDYAYRTWGSEDTINDRMTKLFSELTKEELRMAGQIVRNLAIERSGKGKVKTLERALKTMEALELSEEQILETEVNPYKKPMFISLAVFVPVLILPFLLYGGVFSESVQKWVETIHIFLIATTFIKLVGKLRGFFLFRRAKRGLAEMKKDL